MTRKGARLGTGGIMFSLYSAGYILAAAATPIIVPHYDWQWAFIFAIVPAILVFGLRWVIHESVRFQQAATEIERRVREHSALLPRINNWLIPSAKQRILVGWLLYAASAGGYWGITVFLTTFIVRKFQVLPVDAIYYAMLFYIVQFVLSRGDRIVGLVRQKTGGHRLWGNDDRLHYRRPHGKLPRHVGMLGWLWG